MAFRTSVAAALLLGFTCLPAVAQTAGDKAASKAPADRLDGPPFVTAKSWAVADGRTGRVLWGDKDGEPRPIASTTKVMTAWIVLRLAEADPKALDEEVVFSERAAKTPGSSARLRAGERLPVRELLYGLLLPSGNDAAVALAEHFGARFKSGELTEADPLKLFVAEMNRRAAGLNLKETSYLDPNGLGRNLSSARDLAALTVRALENQRFRDYVQTRRHMYEVTGPNGEKRTVTWENTNKLLDVEGYDGVKTGTTTAAGNCLIASGRRGSDHLLVVVLGSSSGDGRYTDARNLFRWAWNELAHQPKRSGRAVLEPIPDNVVVLTFDDASKSHYTVARPVLQKYKFGATFFISEGWDFATNKTDYMTWDEIAQLHRDGFEIGNHTRDHVAVTPKTVADLSAQVRAINVHCREHGIPEPVSFAYPANAIAKEALPVLKDLGFKFARRGGAPEHPYGEGRGFAYEAGLDHPLLIPTAGDARPAWTMDDFIAAVSQAKHGKIAVLQFHGVPDTAHGWVTTSREQFERYVKYLADNGYKVLALRDLAKYVDPDVTPADPWAVIEDRKRLLSQVRSGGNARPAHDEADLRFWLANMAAHHFAPAEMGAALGSSADKAAAAMTRLGVTPTRAPADRLLVLPYPGGRHPRVGFRDGAIRPQRETKVSAFAPWADGGYAVADVPEAIWFEHDGKRELFYLAHTHVPTIWDKQGVTLDPLEWTRNPDGSLAAERTLPNRAKFGAKVTPCADSVRMELWVANGTAAPLTGLQVQMCVMLKGLTGFDDRTNENKVFAAPFAACRDWSGRRWVVTGWEPCVRAWGNPPCPCLHADPRVPDCPPGETRSVRGWLSFYEGPDIDAELRRLKGVAFAAVPEN